jgi:hypothetical protein
MDSFLKHIYNFFLFFSTVGVLFAQLLNFSYSLELPILRNLYLIGFPILLMAELFQNKKLNHYAFFFFIYCLIVIIFSAFSFLLLSLEKDKYWFYLQILVIQFFYFLLFKNLEYKQNIFFHTLAVISSLLFLTLYFVSDSKELFLYLGRQQEDMEYILSYQGIARIFIILGGLIWSLRMKIFFYWLYFLFFLIILFINGGRSEFAIYLFSGILLFYFKVKGSVINFFSLAALVFVLFSLFNLTDLKDHRIFSLFDLRESLDSGGRTVLNENGFKTAVNNPIFGDFGNWKAGEMAHNFWSFPADYGFLFFIPLSLVLIYYFLLRLIKFIISDSSQNRLLFYFITIWVIGFFSAFWYGNEIFGICSGVLTANNLSFDKKDIL